MKRYDAFKHPQYPDVEIATMQDDDGHVSVTVKGENQEHVRAVAALLDNLPQFKDAVKTESVREG